MPSSVFIADDHQLTGTDTQFSAIAVCSSDKEAIDNAVRYRPNGILTGTDLPEIIGIEAMQKNTATNHRISVIGVSPQTQLSYPQCDVR